MTDKKTDDKYERFVLEQVERYGDMHAKCAKLYVVLAIACVVMGILGLILSKSIVKSIIVALWSLGFIAAKRYYEAAAADISQAADQIRAAIDDPAFDIPDDYPEEILQLRDLVHPTLKNVRSQLIAYGILALTLWAAALFLMILSFSAGAGSDFLLWMFLISIILAIMAIAITILAVRAFRDLPIAKAYDSYLYDEDPS